MAEDGPAFFIDRFFWKRDKKRVIRNILRQHPEFSHLDESGIISHYLHAAIIAHDLAEQEASLQAGRQVVLDIPPLLSRTMKVWGYAQKIVYLHNYLREIIKSNQLAQQVQEYQEREAKVFDVAKRTIRVAETIGNAFDPKKTLN